MPIRRLAAVASLALLAPALPARGQGAVAFMPVPGFIGSGSALTVTPVVSADRRYVRLGGISPVFQDVTGFATFPVPGAVSGGGVNGGLGGLGGGLGGLGGGGGGRSVGTGLGPMRPGDTIVEDLGDVPGYEVGRFTPGRAPRPVTRFSPARSRNRLKAKPTRPASADTALANALAPSGSPSTLSKPAAEPAPAAPTRPTTTSNPAAARLRQAEALSRMGQTAGAREYYEDIVTDFPGSPEASRAEKALRDLDADAKAKARPPSKASASDDRRS